MKKIMDKLLKVDKKTIIFLIIISIAGIITGSLYMTVLNSGDKADITSSLNTFINNLNTDNYINVLTNNLLVNLVYVFAIWILGISIIGLPIVIGIIFIKSFILSFSVATFIANYKLKGTLIGLAYNFPHHIINLILYIYLGCYAIRLSNLIIKCLIHKKNLDFKNIINRYLLILCITLFIIVVTTLFETFVTPLLLKIVVNML